MLMHSFVLDALDTTAADTFSHFEMLIDEHRQMERDILDTIITPTSLGSSSTGAGGGGVQRLIVPSRLKRLVPTIGTFFTRLPLRKAFLAYNAKYGITKRRYVCISFNELRHILNLAQIIALIHPMVEDGGKANKGGESTEDETKKKSTGQQHTLQKSVTDGLTEAWTNMTEDEVMDETKQQQQQQQQRNIHPSSTNSNTSTSTSSSSNDDYRDRSESINIEENLELLLPNNATMPGPKLICFDGDQTLYSDGANFDKSPKLANYLYLLLKHGVSIAVVTAAGYEYQTDKYELRLSGLLAYFKERGLEKEHLERFYIFGGECNYLLQLGHDYHLHAVKEDGPGGWINSTKYLIDCPGNWDEHAITSLLDKAERSFQTSLLDLNVRGSVIRKKRSVGLIPKSDTKIPREALDETVLRVQTELDEAKVTLPFCAFNGGRDTWVDVGNKRVGVQVLQSYLGVSCEETLHIGDQFLLTGNDFAARSVCPCVWITSPEETTYILKSILRLAGVPLMSYMNTLLVMDGGTNAATGLKEEPTAVVADKKVVDFERMSALKMDVYTGEYIK
jgi:IMP and pyridine-specific 5'-nucleotidase